MLPKELRKKMTVCQLKTLWRMKGAVVYQTKTLPAQLLACGAVQYFELRKPCGELTKVTLWKEHSVYHVRAHIFDGLGRLFWDSFPTLTEARARFKQGIKEVMER